MTDSKDRKTRDLINRSYNGYGEWRGSSDEETHGPLDDPETRSQGADQGWGA